MRRALLVVGVALLAARPAEAGLSKEVGARAMPAVVFLVAGEFKDGKLIPIASGSGSILTHDGAVLTNHHVVWNSKKGQLFDFVAVGLLKAYDQSPELTCVAIPKRSLLDRDLDLALIKCEHDLQGRPFRASNWPTIPVGSSEDLVPGASEVFIIGYPGVGGPTVNVTRGTVSGFLGKDRGAGRFWIKTDAAIAHGNSGGTAIDEDGHLVGIPTAVFPGEADIGERVGLMRPVELAKELIARAQGGWQPEGEGTAAQPETPVTPTPPPELPAVACAYQDGVRVSARVIARDTGAGVEGAFVVVLAPGKKRGDVANDYSNLDATTLTYGISDQDGEFHLPCPIPRDTKFSVLVLAKGFVELSANDVLDTSNAPDRFVPWGGKIYLQRAE
jgi:S1-C subfamily serine protease